MFVSPNAANLISVLKHNRPLWVAVQGLIRPTPYTYIISVLTGTI
jgi:hypothetical protein